MREEQELKDEVLRQINAVWKIMHETMQRWANEPLWEAEGPDFGPCPVGDPGAEELQRIFDLESPK